MMTTTRAAADSTPVPPTLPSAAPWYAQGSIADFSMSDVFTFAVILDGLGAFEDTSDVLYYFEKPWKWTEERTRWLSLGAIWDAEDDDQREWVLDNGTTAPNFEAWKTQRDEVDDVDVAQVEKSVSSLIEQAEKAFDGLKRVK